MTKKLINLAQTISNNLHAIEIKGGEDTRVVWKDETPQELREWFQGVTADYTGYSFAALDECYIVLDKLADIITENAEADDITEEIYSNQWSYDGNADLLDWVKADLTRAEDVNEAISQGAADLFAAIQDAMSASRQNMAMSFLQSMEERAGA
jgi:hypothetical protein